MIQKKITSVLAAGGVIQKTLSALFLILFLALMVGVSFSTDMRDFILPFLNEESGFGPLLFVAVLVLAVVLTPITAMPIIPVAAEAFGPLETGVLSVLGWTLGSLAAFVIARGVGRPILALLIPLEKFSRMERYIPKERYFWSIVLLRLILPMDIVSYAVGLLSSIPFRVYALATLIGSIPFSFIFAYMGEALINHEYYDVAVASALGLLVFAAAYFWKIHSHNER